tara:strand:- start:5060 stop:5713 length:654 start_codon:yes stop_codon:yes gene_type:complete
MIISYAICVCNESKDLFSLISFLLKVKDDKDEINILVDTAHVSHSVKNVLHHFENQIVTCEREFDGNFSDHRNFHITQCSGDYIFMIDPDEMPKEFLIQNLKRLIKDLDGELIMVPRINIQPGFTQEWLNKYKFHTNELDWINWPDYQGRIFKNTEKIRWSKGLHEVVSGTDKIVYLRTDPKLGLWHIKSIEKQDNRWGNAKDYRTPKGDNLYDNLM